MNEPFTVRVTYRSESVRPWWSDDEDPEIFRFPSGNRMRKEELEALMDRKQKEGWTISLRLPRESTGAEGKTDRDTLIFEPPKP